MCSIVGSFDKDKIIELCKLNEYRGQVSHSVSLYDVITGKIFSAKSMGALDYGYIEHLVKDRMTYIIVHMQAPTSQKTETIHPAKYLYNYLWHNGILKQEYVKQLKQKLDEVCEWDTFLMLKALYNSYDALNEFDGSFACLMYAHEKLYLFRNEIAPMFYDDNLTISSTKFEGSKSLSPNAVHHVDFNFNDMFPVYKFKTVNNPYYFVE